MESHVFKSDRVKELGRKELRARHPDDMLGCGGEDRTQLLSYEQFLRLPAREQIAYLEERHRIVNEECQGMVEAARERAAELMMEVEREAARSREQAQREGFRAGQEEVRGTVSRQLAERLAPLLSGLVASLEDLAEARERYLESLTEPLVALLLDLVQRLYWDEMAEPARLARIVEAAFAAMKKPDTVTLHLNPEEAAAAEEPAFAQALAAAGVSRGRIEVKPDPAVRRGSLVVSYGGAQLAFSPDEVFAHLRGQLAESSRESEE